MSPTAEVTSTIPTPIDPPAADPVVASEETAVESEASGTESGEVEASEENPAPNFTSQFYPRIALEGGFSLSDLANGGGLANDHNGGYGRLEGGFEYSLSSDAFIQANAVASYGALSRNLGERISSNHDYFQLLVNGRVGWNGFGGNFRLHGGVELGVSHVGAASCSDGLSCGAVFVRNPQLLPIDSWAMTIAGEGGISTLQGGLSAFLRIGVMSGVNPGFDAIDSESSPNFGLHIPYLQVGVQAEVFSLIRAITGFISGSPTASVEEEAESAETAAETEETETSTESTEETTPLSGIALIRDRREQMNAMLSQISQAASNVSAAATAYAAIEGTSVESFRDRRVQVLEMVNQARTAVQVVTDLEARLSESRTALAAIHDAGERREARSVITEMEGALNEARTAASQLYRNVRNSVRDFNRLSPGEDVVIDFEDPRRRTRRRESREPREPREPREESPEAETPEEGGERGGVIFRVPRDEEDEGEAEAPPRVEAPRPETGTPDSVDEEAGE